jgi:hypothetical protein
MTSKSTELVIDCADPAGLARLWCSVLGYEVNPEDEAAVTIGSPLVLGGQERLGPVPPTLTFARMPEATALTWGNDLDSRLVPDSSVRGMSVWRMGAPSALGPAGAVTPPVRIPGCSSPCPRLRHRGRR